MSHDSQHYQALRLTARVFECGGAVCIADGGHLYPALACPKSSAIIAELRAENARLRADNVRVGDRNVLMAMELQTIAEAAEEELGEWLPVVIERLPEAMRFARGVGPGRRQPRSKLERHRGLEEQTGEELVSTQAERKGGKKGKSK